MGPMELLAGQVEWGARNLAHNLEFIPEDRLAWKPAPTANSALEVVNHVLAALKVLTVALSGTVDRRPDLIPATAATALEASALLIDAARECAEAILALKPELMGKIVEFPFGSFPLARVAMFPVVDLLHHHGQIAYIQTLLGDTEDHFVVSDQ